MNDTVQTHINTLVNEGKTVSLRDWMVICWIFDRNVAFRLETAMGEIALSARFADGTELTTSMEEGE